MTPRVLSGVAMPTEALPVAVRRRKWQAGRAVRRRLAWLLLIGWVVLPLLPVFGVVLSMMLGVSLF